jgi:hypothetical protein
VIAVPVRAGIVIVLLPATDGTVSVTEPDVLPFKMTDDIVYPYAVYVPEPAVVHLIIVLDPLVVIVGLPVVVPE